MARRLAAAAGNPFSGAGTGANTPGFPSGSTHVGAVGKTGPHRKKKAARTKHHSKRRG